MRITYNDKNSDYDGPCLDIYFRGDKESFSMGQLFEKMTQSNRCVWVADDHIRIPLISMTETGMAVLPGIETIKNFHTASKDLDN